MPVTTAPRGFPRSARLLKRSHFENVYKNGRRHFATHLTVFYLAKGAEKGARVGLTVGRVLGPAVVRNRIKRRIRDAVRQELAVLTGERAQSGSGVEIVINPKKTAATVAMSVLRAEVAKAFRAVAAHMAKGEQDKG
jgi:ribonuclease P protein component